MAPDAEDALIANDTIVVGGPPPSSDVIPATPPAESIPLSSQFALPSTEDPGSPIDANLSFKTEVNDDRADAAIIPSSLTPPPSTQVHNNNNVAPNAPANSTTYVPSSQRSALFSPPTTVAPPTVRRSVAAPAEYVPPTPEEVRDATPDALRAMMQSSIAENSRLKMEAAHYKLQLNLMSLQAGEDAKRAAVEHDMARREVEALRDGEHARQARRELSAATESARSKYLQARGLYEEASEEVTSLERRLRLAKKVIQQQEDEVCRLRDDRHQLRVRIRENREHFNMLCSPGGMFHGVMTPKQGAATPEGSGPQGSQQAAKGTTPKQSTPRQGGGKAPLTTESSQHRFDALIQVLSQENNSAPSTPFTGYHRPAPRQQHMSRHTRNVQSLSSLPTTPTGSRNRESLLPSVQLAPRTEPPRRFGGRRLLPDSPRREEPDRDRRSRESTISVPDNEELARQALASVQKASSSLSRLSGASRPPADEGEESDVPLSQASAVASEMLRRDPRQSFEVAAAAGVGESPSRLGKTVYADRSMEKRRLSGAGGPAAGEASPTKKAKMGLDRERERVGLGIKY
ncbi:uncharacterized protein DNG_10179 [Cephalotrichum gorgonifer]|uniref:FAD-dependent oxidoreductase-like enzyme n=1 Tax=Cephalotrichum gorgonifer TaxID=2041049 RepID=A0AAE8T020_9PEZI|nr:uncharacterized protein DNG_10179 [Cephalotrichum gorgonifer]